MGRDFIHGDNVSFLTALYGEPGIKENSEWRKQKINSAT